ncbi:hypothetical protein [Rheinheimera sp.]|uniref:hypothetical protein n=1 Tax=Rheinheimera sp. TaxID=1869214 RepID=UPI00404793E3
MKKNKFFFALLFPAVFASACYQADDSNAAKQDGATINGAATRFLSAGAIPEVMIFRGGQQQPELSEAVQQKIIDLRSDGEEDIFVRLKNSAGETVDSWVSENPDETPVITEVFYTTMCGNETLVLVLTQGINRTVSIGKNYINALFDPRSGEWLTTFHGGEIKDTETGEMITDNQNALLDRLKSGNTAHCPEILTPALMWKARDWLLGQK